MRKYFIIAQKDMRRYPVDMFETYYDALSKLLEMSHSLGKNSISYDDINGVNVYSSVSDEFFTIEGGDREEE